MLELYYVISFMTLFMFVDRKLPPFASTNGVISPIHVLDGHVNLHFAYHRICVFGIPGRRCCRVRVRLHLRSGNMGHPSNILFMSLTFDVFHLARG